MIKLYFDPLITFSSQSQGKQLDLKMVNGSRFKTTCSVTWEGTFSKDKNGSWPIVPNCATAVDLLH